MTVPIRHSIMPHTLYGVYESLMTDAGFTLHPFDRIFSPGMVLVTHIEFTILHDKPSALTWFMLRWPRLEFTVSEL
jgi:hypothetical protein